MFTNKLFKGKYVFSVFLDDDDPVNARVSQRIEDVTGLSMETAEPLLVRHLNRKYTIMQHIFFTVFQLTWT